MNVKYYHYDDVLHLSGYIDIKGVDPEFNLLHLRSFCILWISTQSIITLFPFFWHEIAPYKDMHMDWS